MKYFVKSRRYLFACALTFALACSKHNDFKPIYKVPMEIQKHIDAFINEASKRGHSFTIDNLILKYDDNLPNNFCGICNSISTTAEIQKIISITPNRTRQCWSNEVELETLVFHELGHCFLGRDHLNTLLPKGDPKSIMVENNIALYSPCPYPIGGPCDNLYKRTYYLDELFDETTPVPAWGK